jgi:lysophospholipase L1-like esterase
MRRSSVAWLVVLAPLLACGGKGSTETATDAGSGGAGGDTTDGGAGGAAGSDGAAPDVVVVPPACDPTASTMGAVTDASPLLAILATAASDGVQNLASAFNGAYHSGTPAILPTPAADADAAAAPPSPPWIAAQVAAGPTRLLLMWSDPGFSDYTNLTDGNSPTAYRIEVSGDSTNGSDGTWDKVVEVTDNPVRNRAHSFPFVGKSWVRFVVTAPAPGRADVRIDEIELHDLTSSGDGRPSDTWFFMGDSITAGAFKRNLRGPFDQLIHAAHPGQAPIMLNGGIGGELSAMGLQHIDLWLTLNPDFTHFAILYGTNDSWGDKDAASSGMQANMEMIVQKVLAAGRVPILGRIPYATMAHATVPSFNAIIDQISTNDGLPCGPDFYGWFETHPTQLGSDGVHPNDIGYISMNQLWADVAMRFYRAN